MIILDLPLKRKWYEMIESGTKTEEYRELKPYWGQRLIAKANPKPYFGSFFDSDVFPLSDIYLHPQSWYLVFKQYTHVCFRYGYTKRTMLREIESISIGYGKPEWGAPTGKKVFIIKFKKGDNDE